MSARKTLTIALVWAYSLLLSCSEAWAWQTNINGATNGGDGANAVAVDPAGNVVAVGSTQNKGNPVCGNDFTIAKFDGVSGAELWRKEISSGGCFFHDNGVANAVAIDGGGNVVAAGSVSNFDFEYQFFMVVKFDGLSGAELWRQVGGAYDSANAVAVDPAGNVVVAGYSWTADTGYDFMVVKFDGVSGTELWRQVINGTANGDDFANAVAVDAAGNVVAAAATANSGSSYSDFTVVKFDGATGSELWRKDINGTNDGYDYANALAVDGAGNVVAAGATSDVVDPVGDETFTVIKLDGTSGAELWRKVVVPGYYDGTGLANGSGWANAVAVDTAQNVVAAGHVHAHTGSSSEFAVVKFDGASGTELWRNMIHSGANDLAHAVVLDAVDNVVAAGITENQNTGIDFTVVKFDGVTGLELWRQVIDGSGSDSYDLYDSANAIAVDAAGNIIAVGHIYNAGTGTDFTVVKFTGIPVTLLDLTANVASPQNLGTSITFTAIATDGITPLHYKWWVFNGSWWELVQNWSSSNSFSWTPAATGNFKVAVWVRSSGNTVDWPENNAYGVMDFTVTPLSVTSLTADKTSPQPAGTTINFSAATTGGRAPIQYKWWVYNGSWWELVQNWSTSNSFNWTPTVPGNFKIAVWVRSGGNTIDAPENNAYGVVDFAVYPLSVTGLTADKTSPQLAGTTITFTAATQGGLAPIQYKWWMFNGASWVLMQNWSTNNTYSWIPTVTGNFKIAVWVRSGGNTIDAPENNAYGVTDFNIYPLSVIGVTADKTSPQPAGTIINFTAATTGGVAPIQYKWWVYNGMGWSSVQNWSTSNSFSWTPAVTGNFKIAVWVTSSGNTVDWPENDAYGVIDFAAHELSAPSP